MQERRVWAEIDLDALSHNLALVRNRAGAGKGVMAIVKANAYGHGAVPVAWHLAALGVHALGVGDSQEAIELRRAGISIPILVLGAIVPGEMASVLAFDISVTVHSAERARVLEHAARRAGRVATVHLKVDTGMGRLGCTPERATEIARLIADSRYLRFAGLCTHFSSVGADQDGFTDLQTSRFDAVTEELRGAGILVPMRHAAASGAILNRIASHLDVVRPGLALYGLSPLREIQEDLRPVLSLKSQVIFLKDFPAGSPVGYNREYVTPRPTRIATLPVGYNDGYPFRLGGRAQVFVRGRRAPVVGRISMDYLSVDVGAIPGVSVGDEAVLIGRSGQESITAIELAERAGTIPYEILTGLGRRVERVYRSRPAAAPREAGFAILERPGLAEKAPPHR